MSKDLRLESVLLANMAENPSKWFTQSEIGVILFGSKNGMRCNSRVRNLVSELINEGKIISSDNVQGRGWVKYKIGSKMPSLIARENFSYILYQQACFTRQEVIKECIARLNSLLSKCEICDCGCEEAVDKVIKQLNQKDNA